MKPISPQKRRQALTLLENGMSARQIAQDIGISKSMVSKIRKAANKELPKPKSGRKKKLNARHIAWINKHIEKNPKTTLRKACHDVLQQLKIKLAPTTLRKALLFSHFRARKIIKKPLLEPRHKKARLQFALDHRDWTVDDWRKVIWSDETKINRLGSDGTQHCWIKGAGFSSKLVRPTMKYGGGSIMVWGCMTAKGVGTLHIVPGRMTAVIYIGILSESLLPVITTLGVFNDNDEVIFQQDNDPKHTANATYEWLDNNNIRLLDWPAQSPDLNPIEHLWTELKKRIYQHKDPATGMLVLERRMREAWAQIPVTLCQALIDSMPRRIEAVIKAKGGVTKY